MSIESIVNQSAHYVPEIEGPIEVTSESHPFCAMKYSRTPLNLEEYGYKEEEFFFEGKANIYDSDENDNLLVIKEGVKYKNRIIVRTPIKKESFSGRVYVDILNATQRYDIEDLWHRIYLWCMENGHAYVGITSKPVNVASLKNFDYQRYSSLDWSNGETIPLPTITTSDIIPGTEEGLVWDIISQVGNAIKSGTKSSFFEEYDVNKVYLCGQSQSGAYLNTYVSYFDSIVSSGTENIFDGYLNIVGAFVQRSLRQQKRVGSLLLEMRHMHPSTQPYICISSEGDFTLFSSFLNGGNLLDIEIKNTDQDKDKCRYYEIPETPHTDIICPVLTSLDEIKKTGAKLPFLDDKLLKNINDIHTEYYICGLLEKLHNWAEDGIAPEIAHPLLRSGNGIAKDKYGNSLGGLRTPYVDVPIARYIACNSENPEGISGKMKYFSSEEAHNAYGSADNYLNLFAHKVLVQEKEGWISHTDGLKMIQWSQKAAANVF